MAIADKIETYEVHIAQNNFLDYNRSIRLSLESGGTAFIAFSGGAAGRLAPVQRQLDGALHDR